MIQKGSGIIYSQAASSRELLYQGCTSQVLFWYLEVHIPQKNISHFPWDSLPHQTKAVGPGSVRGTQKGTRVDDGNRNTNLNLPGLVWVMHVTSIPSNLSETGSKKGTQYS